MASTFVYGMYGLQHAAWANKIASCGGAGPQIAFAIGGGIVPGPPDDFEARARQVLEHENPKLLSDLLALRPDTQRFATQRWPGFSPPSAETLNARNQHFLQFVVLSGRHALPTVFHLREFAAAGGLMSYEPSLAHAYRQEGIYAGRILKGEKPAEMPVQQAVKVELVINLQTAKTLGLTIPLPLLGRAR